MSGRTDQRPGGGRSALPPAGRPPGAGACTAAPREAPPLRSTRCRRGDRRSSRRWDTRGRSPDIRTERAGAIYGAGLAAAAQRPGRMLRRKSWKAPGRSTVLGYALLRFSGRRGGRDPLPPSLSPLVAQTGPSCDRSGVGRRRDRWAAVGGARRGGRSDASELIRSEKAGRARRPQVRSGHSARELLRHVHVVAAAEQREDVLRVIRLDRQVPRSSVPCPVRIAGTASSVVSAELEALRNQSPPSAPVRRSSEIARRRSYGRPASACRHRARRTPPSRLACRCPKSATAPADAFSGIHQLRHRGEEQEADYDDHRQRGEHVQHQAKGPSPPGVQRGARPRPPSSAKGISSLLGPEIRSFRIGEDECGGEQRKGASNAPRGEPRQLTA